MTAPTDIAGALREAIAAGRRAALVSVVETEGSVYRRSGARCVVLEDGRIIGVVSGGCVERDLLEHAQRLWSTGAGELLTYDFRSSDDPIWGMGLGCNGALRLWMQPLDLARDPALTAAWLADAEHRDTCSAAYWVATVMASDDPERVAPGTLVTLSEDGSTAAGGLHSGVRPLSVGGVMTHAYVERIAPRERLYVFGAGDDAPALVRQARFVGFHVTIVDHRSAWATEARFPDADARLVIGRDEYGTQPVQPHTYAVSMTHNYELDEQVFRRLLPAPITYLGMLGPRQRTDRMLAGLTQGGMQVDPAALQKLHAPVGLDIGAETPEEIALSVVAEMIAVRSGSAAGFMRSRSGPIHLPPAGRPNG